MTSIWDNTVILHTKTEHVNKLIEMDNKAEQVYGELTSHLKTTSYLTHSKIDALLPLLGQYDDVIYEIDRVLLNLYIYTNYIRTNHANRNVSADQSEKIGQLLNMICSQRTSLMSTNYADFIFKLTEFEAEDSDSIEYLGLLERRTFRIMLNSLMNAKMIVRIVIKHLENCDHVLDNLDIKLRSNTHFYN